MIGSLLAAAILLQAPPGPTAAADAAAAAVTVETDRAEVYVGEPVRIRIRVALDAERFRERAVPLTLRRTDLPVLLDAPWLRGLREPEPAAGPTLLAGDGVAAAAKAGTETRDGRTFRWVRLERLLVPDRPGPLVLAAPRLRWAEAARREEDALGEGIPRDRSEHSVEGDGLALRVLPLPEAGKPEGFAGPVGEHFMFRVTADRAEVALGDSVRLTLVVTGDGDPASFPEPDPSPLKEFHVLGRLQGPPVEGGRSWIWEIAPLRAGDLRIGGLGYTYFGTGPPSVRTPGYLRLPGVGIPLRVLPGTAPPPAPPADVPQERDSPPWPAVLLGAGIVAAVVLLARRRR